ncbi:MULTISPECIES: LytR/AlgR family response regulator transcription factor [Sphingobacterium]|uniref:LytR/AlgR family response regulator transcription factor n=1 Tax=Sphingobacterium TaxID=28453 RepID=UPI00211B7FED|nr:LytTR family DNA-binding domain-containing protein [Sphingobacterium sp. E70]ULT27227.1 LytTR family transcriptional regulator [Sphingobacterium sp. E70]
MPVVIHLSILPFIAALFSTVFFNGVYDLFKFFSYTLTHHLGELIAVYTGFVIGYKYLMEPTTSKQMEESKPALDTIVINNGKDNVIIQIADIVQITAATPYISIHLENKRYLHAETLKAICERLDSNTFIRVHKSTIVNISKVRSFKSRLNGDYDLLLTDSSSLRLSRTYAADFKTRFATGTSG